MCSAHSALQYHSRQAVLTLLDLLLLPLLFGGVPLDASAPPCAPSNACVEPCAEDSGPSGAAAAADVAAVAVQGSLLGDAADAPMLDRRETRDAFRAGDWCREQQQGQASGKK